MKKKEEVEKFLKEHFPDIYVGLMDKLTVYYDFVLNENQKINLISRKTDPEDIWTLHFLDSLLSIQCVNYADKKVLDFGTGGGFPGIPLAVLYSNAHFYLLDSTKKKIQSVRAGATILKLTNCDYFDIRLEDVPKNFYGTFDIVVSRSVRITSEFKKVISNLLNSDGQVVLYKSQNLEDAALFRNFSVCDVSTPLIGERKIVVVRKSDFD